MSATEKPYDVGYAKPPKCTQWKKGQCGNPKQVRKKAHKTLVQMVDEVFDTKIDSPVTKKIWGLGSQR